MILFSKDVACGNSADKTDERGVSVGALPLSILVALWWPLSSGNSLQGLRQRPVGLFWLF